MPILNETNYPNAVPVSDDFTLFVVSADGTVKTATMNQLAELFSTIAGGTSTVSVISSNTVLVDEQVIVSNSGAPVIATLPSSGDNIGRQFRLYNAGAGSLTVNTDGSDTISGSASISLAQYESVTLVSDGIGTWILF